MKMQDEGLQSGILGGLQREIETERQRKVERCVVACVFCDDFAFQAERGKKGRHYLQRKQDMRNCSRDTTERKIRNQELK